MNGEYGEISHAAFAAVFTRRFLLVTYINLQWLCHTKICRELSGREQLSHVNYVRDGVREEAPQHSHPSHKCERDMEEHDKREDFDINAKRANNGGGNIFMALTPTR